jgi:hypothetical protein
MNNDMPQGPHLTAVLLAHMRWCSYTLVESATKTAPETK